MKIVQVSAIIGILFVLLSLPDVYIWLDKHIPHRYLRFTYDNCPGIPTLKGMVVQGGLFFCLSYLLLSFQTTTQEQRPVLIEQKPPPPTGLST